MTPQEYLDKMPDTVFPYQRHFSDGEVSHLGITQLGLFSAMAMQGIIAAGDDHPKVGDYDPVKWAEYVAKIAVNHALCLIKEIEKVEKTMQALKNNPPQETTVL